MVEYDINRPWLTLDDWQKQYIEAKGNTFLLCGRQSGKSTAAAIKFGKQAATNKKQTILMIAYTEKQAFNLFSKTLVYLNAEFPASIKMGKDKPTQHRINLKNGSIIMCYASGTTGQGLVGYTLTDLVVDEAALMNREIFDMLTPTLSVTNGRLHLLSTPRGKTGFFYECSDDLSLGDKIRKDFTRFYVSAENCPRHTKEFLEMERKTKSALIYAQEYKAEFLDELMRLFPDDILMSAAVLDKPNTIEKGKYYLGVDVGGLGDEESAFDILKKVGKDEYNHVWTEETRRTHVTETTFKILSLEAVYNFRKIGIDNGGLGVGVFHPLLLEKTTRNKVVGLNNASKELDEDGKKKTTLLKVDMYMHFRSLLENGKVKLLKDNKIISSLSSIQYEIVDEPGQEIKYKIWGRNDHHADALIRACWLATQDKSLSIWAR